MPWAATAGPLAASRVHSDRVGVSRAWSSEAAQLSGAAAYSRHRHGAVTSTTIDALVSESRGRHLDVRQRPGHVCRATSDVFESLTKDCSERLGGLLIRLGDEV